MMMLVKIRFCLLILGGLLDANGFLVPRALSTRSATTTTATTASQLFAVSTESRGRGFGVIKEEKIKQMDKGDLELENMDIMQVKAVLLDLLPRMTGTAPEFQLVESCVNKLEEQYSPVQTLDFLNLAMGGDWQLLFSTNLARGPKPNFRLRELFQRVETVGLVGTVINQATWDLAEDGSTFDATGKFSVKCSYKINQGARMVMDLEDHLLEPTRGSKIPKDVPALVGLLHRAMPKELFDPKDHAMDTTYLDGDLRIVRMTGPNYEGVRDIFIRRGSMEINPTAE
jgi:hypothetical protein